MFSSYQAVTSKQLLKFLLKLAHKSLLLQDYVAITSNFPENVGTSAAA